MLVIGTVWCDVVEPSIRGQDGRWGGVVVKATVVVGGHSRSGGNSISGRVPVI
jgi:hypothetical protein